MKHENFAETLLAWYDQNARELPWRILPHQSQSGVVADPYRIWLSEVMLQQTTVATVKDYFERFTSRWPTVVDLANEDDDMVLGEWAGLGYYARARNLLKCARVVRDRFNGRFSDTRAELLDLPGIGPYTAAAISSIAFDRSETVVDGNVERVVSRLLRIETPLPASKPQISLEAEKLTPKQRAGDYAQAMMDLGATICTPKSPTCHLCPTLAFCEGEKAGDQTRFPLKMPKKPKPTRKGVAFVALTQSREWIVERRPEKGLLGGMIGWPGSDWSEAPTAVQPFAATWFDIGSIKHTFTHFHLELDVCVAENVALKSEDYILKPQNEFRASDLPTVMRKAFDLAQTHIGKPAI